MIKNENLYVVKWIDSSIPLNGTWTLLSDIENPENMVCLSVGWIIKETKDNIVIVPHIAGVNNIEDASVYGSITIPKCAILKKKKLNINLHF